MTRVCVMGLGYVGLPTASLLASKGFDVLGVDVSEPLLAEISKGHVSVPEPNLEFLVRSAVMSGRLTVSTTPQGCDVFVIAVPTPFAGKHEPDLSYVDAATRAVAPLLVPGNLVILESTCPVGTTERVAGIISELNKDVDVPRRSAILDSRSKARIYLAHCPERVLPGRILTELIENDRVVGGIDPASSFEAGKFYEKFVSGKLLLTDSRTAELCKLAENAFRDVNIAFANELASISSQLGIDPWDVIDLANHHPRVRILRPGPGVGGHCVAVDPWFIVHSAPKLAKLIKAAREVNAGRPAVVARDIRKVCDAYGARVVACLGLSYKANIGDLRESPALEVVRLLANSSRLSILAADPHVGSVPKDLESLPNVSLLPVGEALARADVVALLVDHDAFRTVSPDALRGKKLVDSRGFWRPAAGRTSR